MKNKNNHTIIVRLDGVSRWGHYSGGLIPKNIGIAEDHRLDIGPKKVEGKIYFEFHFAGAQLWFE